MSGRERKLSENEVVFRAFNEGVREVEQRVGDSAVGEFVCECSDPDCEERIKVSLDEYAQLRADPIRFFVKSGHELAALERVIWRTDDFLVVEKRERAPAQIPRE